MRLKLFTTTTLSVFLLSSAQADTAQEDARENAMKLGKALKTELTTAMKSAGPLAAIEVCNTKAMPIGDEISAKTGWIVARTSLKTRNSVNQPDIWEREQLNAFEQRLAAGEPVGQLESFIETEENGYKVQRFMKAIPTEEGCLACHGEQLAPAIANKIDALYPQDKARGFAVGQLRGAFTLQRTVK